MRAKGAALRSGITGIADQSAVALTNLLLTVFAAQGGVDSLGSFALVSATYFAVLVLIRALVAEPYMALGKPQFDSLYGSTALLFCVGGGLVAAGASFFVFVGPIPWLLMPLLVFGLTFYEFARIRAYVRGHSGVALSASCVGLAVVAAGGFFDVNHSSDRWLRLAIYWLLAGICGYAVILVQSGGVPVLRAGAWSWFRKMLLPQGRFLAFDAAGTVLVAHVGLFLLGQLGGLAQVASMRATTTLLSPVSLVFTGLTLSLTPILAGSDSETKARTLRAFWVLIAATSVVAVIIVGLFGKQLIATFFGAAAVPPDATLFVAVASIVMFSIGAPLLAQVRVHGTYMGIAVVRVLTGAALLLFILMTASLDLGLVFFGGQFVQAAAIGATAVWALRLRGQH